MGEIRTTRGEAPPLPAKAKRWKRIRIVLFILLALAAVAGAGLLIPCTRWIAASGYVTTDEYAEVRPPANGVVTEIKVRTGMRVAKGGLLVQLDAAEMLAELKEAQSRVQKNEAELARLELDVAEQKRQLAEAAAKARTQMEYATARLLRTRELLAKGLVAGTALEDDILKEKLARMDLESIERRDPSIYIRQIEVVRRELQANQDAVARIEARLPTREIRAPIAGQVLRYEFVPGQLVTSDQVLMEIFGGDRQVLKVRIPERDAAKVRTGQAYRARLASYGNLIQRVWFRGQTEFLRDAIQSEGSTNYRVAYCTFDSRGLAVPPGTTALVEIDGGKIPLWSWLFGLD